LNGEELGGSELTLIAGTELLVEADFRPTEAAGTLNRVGGEFLFDCEAEVPCTAQTWQGESTLPIGEDGIARIHEKFKLPDRPGTYEFTLRIHADGPGKNVNVATGIVNVVPRTE
jgi:hypothetical protein